MDGLPIEDVILRYMKKEMGEQNIECIFFIKPLKENTKSDIHIVSILNNIEHTVYRHVLPAFSPVNRRLEIGCFPKNYFKDLVASGYINMQSITEIEKLKCATTLYQKNEGISGLKSELENITVGNIFMGDLLKNLKISIKMSKQFLENSKYHTVIKTSREIATTTLCILLLVKYKVGFSKYMHIYERAKKYAAREIIKKYEAIQNNTEANLSEFVNDCIGYIILVFDSIGIKRELLPEVASIRGHDLRKCAVFWQ
ncbi:MAG: hypothetical protein QMC80_02505 [Thermoplasmatales archaeon]|nr:hypothetical protein [Thermoplasmatales archaeon]